MKKLKIFIYHLVIFIAGSISIVVYVFIRLTSPANNAGLGGLIVMPAVAFIYVVVFGIFCAISLTVWILVAHFRRPRRSK